MPSPISAIVPGGSPIAHHVHTHLAGSAAGIDLFGRSADAQLDPDIGAMVRDIHRELLDERRRLRRMADDLGVGESKALTLAARAGERVGRLKPNGSLTERTDMTDLVELEAMRTAVAGKHAGWQALLSVVDVHPALDRTELEELIAQAEAQQVRLAQAHTQAAARALVR
ncbi:hypothetical protein [Aeromicrobium sp. 50.2.37]|uniref:hypothetical protein n=1 Tax=Aeromicrobium sp. 50.2.37 TaxID=2969305 RepID=UPI0021506958|nr:hypothetical protein [Aeromicrobium sp. 50.2.37]MCR4514150.1 hypothetical protein [Aeromicrobium sp. 50.2.37]